jgi:acetyltransferase
MRHYLRSLLEPASVALVGASEVPGSLGRAVYENLIAGGFAGPIYAINPRHREVLGRPAWPTLAALGAEVDLAVIATPQSAVASVLESARAAKVRVAVVMTSPDAIDTEASRAWSAEIAQAAMRANLRVVGPGALGIIRTPAKLDATYCAPRALPGRLALIAQSAAVAAAMLDFAAPLRIGFSTVVSVGGGIDIAFGELLDLLLADPQTDGIVVHVEEIGDARQFLSALRAAARTKPVVVLKAGRSLEQPAPIPHDEVFDAALRRSGTVRVDTYMQLFAAARILAHGRVPQGNRLAIVSNGRGPAVMAADRAFDRGIELASLTDATASKLDALLGHRRPLANPIDVRGDAAPPQLAAAAALALDDAHVDAVIALHVPRPGAPAVEAAHALAGVAVAHRKPLVAAWLGAVDRPDVHAALDAVGVPNFYTPETSVDALSFLMEYRNNQSLLLEAPPPSPEPQRLDVGRVEALRVRLADSGRRELAPAEAEQVLSAFGLIGKGTTRRAERARRDADAQGLVMGIATDRCFGPIVFVRPAAVHPLAHRRAVMLPPLNERLAADLLTQACDDVAAQVGPAAVDVLVASLTRLSALACALPWVRALTLELEVVNGARVTIGDATFDVEPQRRLMRGYPHVAIHPYPVELIGDVALRDGTVLHVRPIRPEDGALERAFVERLSEQSRYYRFFHRLSELTPAMLARFTQVDYDRELALVALKGAGTDAAAFVGVARYIANPDRASAEFAVVVADEWQRRGVGAVLMRGLIVCAKRRGFERLIGMVLRENEPMIEFVRALGFDVGDDPQDPAQVCATLRLQEAA